MTPRSASSSKVERRQGRGRSWGAVVVEGPEADVPAATLADADQPLEHAEVGDHVVYVDGEEHAAKLYDRIRLAPGHEIPGPAVIMEMDSTTLILPDHRATVDHVGNLLIRPMSLQEAQS